MLLGRQAVERGHRLVDSHITQVLVQHEQAHRGRGIQGGQLRRLPGQQRFGLLAVGDVLNRAEYAPACSIRPRLARALDPAQLSVGTMKAALIEQSRAVLRCVLHRLFECCTVFGMDKFRCKAGSRQRRIGAGHAQDGVGPLVLPDDAIAVGLPAPDAQFGGVGRQAQPLLAGAQRRLGALAAGQLPPQADEKQQQGQSAQAAAQDHPLQGHASVRDRGGAANFQELRLRRLGLGDPHAGLVHEGLVMQCRKRRAGGRKAPGFSPHNGFFKRCELGCDQRRNNVQALLLTGVVGSQAAQLGQMDTRRGQTRVVRLQIIWLASDDEALLPGLGILEGGQQVTELLGHRTGVCFPLLRLVFGLHAVIGEPADADQTDQNHHRQGIHQVSFKGHHRSLKRGRRP